MPELPEVETIVRTCRPRLVGRRILAFRSGWQKNCLPSALAVRRGIVGRRVARLARRGKYIVLALHDGGFLLVHLRMSGRLAFARPGARTPPHVRAVWTLDGHERLLLHDARKFARISYTRDLSAATARLGVEPLGRGFTADRLAGLLRGRRRRLKPLLLDQSLVAGLGNIYADEALFHARLHPLARSQRLEEGDVERLHAAIRQVLRHAIRRRGTSFDSFYRGGRMQRHLAVYGRGGAPCRVCGTPIASIRLAQRSTHFCPKCQAPNGVC